MDKRKAVIAVMFLLIGAFAIFQTLGVQAENGLPAENVVKKPDWCPGELWELCQQLKDRLLLLIVAMPFAITAALITANAVILE